MSNVTKKMIGLALLVLLSTSCTSETVPKEPSDNTIQQTDGQQGARNVSLEDILLFGEAGGTYLRTEGPHMAPNPHRFKHINYHTATGVKGTIFG